MATKNKLGPDRLPNQGRGRPKGAVNKVTKELKDMILGALSDVGGQAYLSAQAEENPKAFLALLGRVLPMQVTGEGGGPVIVALNDLDERA